MRDDISVASLLSVVGEVTKKGGSKSSGSVIPANYKSRFNFAAYRTQIPDERFPAGLLRWMMYSP